MELSPKSDSLGTAIASALKRVVDLPPSALVSEEDVKNKVVLPMLKALGYDDADFNYEAKTGRGYVDIVLEHFPTGVVVEAKAPRKRLENYLGQLETYVFHKHRRAQATIAILTDGESFHVYGVTEALWKDSLEDFRILSFSRRDLCSPAVMSRLIDLVGRENNQRGAIADVIASYQKSKRDRLGPIETELERLTTERKRIDVRIEELRTELGVLTTEREPIDVRIEELRTERKLMHGSNARDGGETKTASAAVTVSKFPAIPHILRLLQERNAKSRSSAVDRKWLDEKLVNKIEGVGTGQAVSFGLIELKRVGKIDYEGPPIKAVWLKL